MARKMGRSTENPDLLNLAGCRSTTTADTEKPGRFNIPHQASDSVDTPPNFHIRGFTSLGANVETLVIVHLANNTVNNSTTTLWHYIAKRVRVQVKNF
jgi:hypothetical protein